jgi:hypothetical protein
LPFEEDEDLTDGDGVMVEAVDSLLSILDRPVVLVPADPRLLPLLSVSVRYSSVVGERSEDVADQCEYFLFAAFGAVILLDLDEVVEAEEGLRNLESLEVEMESSGLKGIVEAFVL